RWCPALALARRSRGNAPLHSSPPGRTPGRISSRTNWSHLGMTDATTTAVDQRPNRTDSKQALGGTVTRSAVFGTGTTASDGAMSGEYVKGEKIGDTCNAHEVSQLT